MTCTGAKKGSTQMYGCDVLTFENLQAVRGIHSYKCRSENGCNMGNFEEKKLSQTKNILYILFKNSVQGKNIMGNYDSYS